MIASVALISAGARYMTTPSQSQVVARASVSFVGTAHAERRFGSRVRRKRSREPHWKNHFGGTDRSYSCLSAAIGSTRAALHAGTTQAINATAANRTDTPASVKGSMGSVAKSID